MFTPSVVRGTTKFGGAGGLAKQLNHLNLPLRAQKTIEELGNFGLSQKTWGSYKTSERMWFLCQKETKQKLALPWGPRETVIFIDWLVNDREVGAATIGTYLSGVRKLHILNGFDEPNLRNNFINDIIKGKLNKERILKRTTVNKGRLPVTLTLLKLIKELIRKSDLPLGRKLLLWCVCTLSFFGGFRIHEILSRNESFYDPDFTLMVGDIRITEFTGTSSTMKVLEVTVKSPKESRVGKDVIVDVFEAPGSLCPLKAFSRWAHKSSTYNLPGPLFRDDDGTPLTGRKFNTHLRSLLCKVFDYKKEKITSHSFRGGLASLLAASGVSIAELKQAGRWNSRSWEHYVKVPRAQRALLAEKVAGFL